MLNPVGPAATFVDTPLGSTPWAGTFVKDADPAIIDALAAAGKLETRRRLHALVPALLALRHPARLLGQAHVVRAHVRAQGRAAARERDHRLAPRRTSSTGASATGSRTTSTGRCRATASGARRCRCGAATTAAPTRASARWPSSPSGRAATSPTSTSTGPRSTTSPSTARSASGPARVASTPCSTRGSTPARCRRRSSTTRSSNAGPMFESRFPADFICEAIDQTRGWFYSLLAVNTLVFGRTPYRNVVCLALVVDKDGQKMSKSKGNVIDPWTVLDTRGADALRWNFFSAGSPWTPRRVSVEAIDESARFLVTLWNTYSFFVTYANLDGWTPGADRGRQLRRTCSTGGCARACTTPSPRSPTRSTASTRCAARRRSRRSSTICRTGTCAGRGRGSGTRTTRRPTRRCTSASRRSRSCSRRSRRSSPTSCTATWPAPCPNGKASSRCTWPTGPRSTTARSTTPSKPRWSAPVRSCRSASRPATRPSSRCASRCGARWCCSPTAARSPTRSRPRSPTRST